MTGFAVGLVLAMVIAVTVAVEAHLSDGAALLLGVGLGIVLPTVVGLLFESRRRW